MGDGMSVELSPTMLSDAAVDGLRNVVRAGHAARRPRISVGIVNNMPDAAMQTTERQFLTHLEGGAEDFDLRAHLFSLPGIPRAGDVLDRVKVRYLDYDCLSELHMDALIVTGAVPKAASLAKEPFWPHLTKLADWARTHTLSVLWSCLSAHAAVLHIDGIERQRLPKKLSGLYQVETRNNDPVLAGTDPVLQMPHSRYNGLPEESLRAAGYTILSRSDIAGVDMFSKSTPSLFVFCQGHPEYDGDTLMREYRRDALQYLVRERGEYPDIPSNYFNPATEAALDAFARKAQRERSADLSNQFPDLRDAVPHIGVWHSAAEKIFHNWINHVATLKMRQLERRGAAA
jgi:homoserine O-succinyltransferase